MNCEESANEVVDAIDVDEFVIEWSTTEKVIAHVVMFISNAKARVCG